MNIVKKTALLIAALIFSLSFFGQAFAKAQPPIKIRVNNKTVQFEISPIIENGTTLVPFRAILEELGASVEWNEKTKTITCRKKTKTVLMKIGSKTMTVGNNHINLDVSPKIINNRTLIPLRAISQAFDAEVDWNAKSRIIDITVKETNQTDIIASTAKNSLAQDELTSIINQLTQKRSYFNKASAEEFVTLLNQINAYKRTVKSYGSITDTDKLAEIQRQYKVYIDKLKALATKNNIPLN